MDDSSQTLVASLASNLESFHMQSKNRKRIRRDSNKTKELAGKWLLVKFLTNLTETIHRICFKS